MKHRDFRRLPLREHDGVPYAERGQVIDPVIDLASSHNAYGPSPALLAALAAAPLAGYPEPTSLPARAAVARRFGSAPERVLIGAGAFELLWTATRVLVRSGDTVLTVEPGGHELAAAARQLGARVVQWRAVERLGHRVELDQVAELMTLEKPALVGLCAPTTPAGAGVAFDEINTLALRFPDTYFVVDQSLLALSDDHEDLELLPHDNVLCIRSLGKELGVPGLRVGYCLAEGELTQRMETARPAFSVSAPAQAATVFAMSDDAQLALRRARDALRLDRDRLGFVLAKLGLVHTPSVAPFFMVRMARASEVAHELLAEHRIAVLPCAAYGLPDHLRISALCERDERPFAAALRAVVAKRKLTHGRES